MDELEYYQTVAQWEMYLNTDATSAHTLNYDNQSIQPRCVGLSVPAEGVGYVATPHF